MKLKRRQVLALGGLFGLGLAALTRSLWGRLFSNPAVGDTAQAGSAADAIATPIAEAVKPTPLRFIAVADTGTGDAGQYAVADAMAQYHRKNPCSFAVLAGDNIYNNGEIEKIGAVFEEPYKPLLQSGVKFHACLGNHDVRTDNGDPQVRYPGFNMQGRYYTFQYQTVQFFALDTNGNADWDAQLIWLEKELRQSQAPWKIVFGHHQIYSSGHYGVNQPFVEALVPLFQKYRVQLYINGHDHHYERTQVIDGTTYLICGGGAGTRPVGRSAWTAHSASQLSFAALEVYPDRLLIHGIGTDNQVFDRGILEI